MLLCCVVLRCVAPRCVSMRRVVLPCVVAVRARYEVGCCRALRCVASCRIVLRCNVLCCGVFCCVMLCGIVLILCSEFGTPQMFGLSAARMPQAVARAVARSCADVSQLLLKLRAPLLAVAICKCLQKLSTSGSDFGNPQRFQVSATLMPQAVARAVVRSCVNASRLQPQLLHAVLSRLVLQLLEKL